MAEIEKNETGKSENATASTGFTPMSGSDLEKQRKSRKKELLAAAIGEGISSLSNIFFASKGAPASKSSSMKRRQPTLIERIYGRHNEEDSAYGKHLSAWEKEQEKKRKEAERLAKENEREDIHADFKPLRSHWNDREFIGQMYEDLLGEICLRNRANGKSSSKLQDHLTQQKKMVSARLLPYLQQSILYDVLDGSLEYFDDEYKEELDDEFLKNFRIKWADNDSGWERMK